MGTGLTVELRNVDWPRSEAFVTSGSAATVSRTLEVTVRDAEGHHGRGEAAGVHYLGEDRARMRERIEAVAPRLGSVPDRARLEALLPPGGARNALDCALWELEARRADTSVFALLGVAVPGPLVTLCTVGLRAPEAMAARARAYGDVPLLKLKLGGRDGLDVARVEAVRRAAPHARLLVDANCAWDRRELARTAPRLVALGVEMIEQPLPRGADAALDGYDGPGVFCADESCQSREELDALAARYAMVNVKLDKCGGLTAARALVRAARERGLEPMVGCMGGSSLAMAPAMIIAAECRYADLDGPLLQLEDQPDPLVYREGTVAFGPRRCWG